MKDEVQQRERVNRIEKIQQTGRRGLIHKTNREERVNT